MSRDHHFFGGLLIGASMGLMPEHPILAVLAMAGALGVAWHGGALK